MTREEAIKQLKDASDSEVRYGDIDNRYDEVMKRVEAFEMAIEALKQESVLDKIRAEIANLDDADYDYEGYFKAVTDAVKIIDKYRAESEVEDNAKSEVEVCSRNFIQLKQDVLNNKQLWQKLREIEDEDSD